MIRQQTVIKFALAFLMIAFIIKAGAMLFFYPHYDSNYYLNIAINYLARGELTPYMWRLGADSTIIAGSGTGYGLFIQLIWFQIFGVSVLSGHILNYLLGVITLVVLYFLSRNWWSNSIAGWISITFLALTGSFIEAFYIRMDTPGILIYTIVLLVHLHAVRTEQLKYHALTGVLVILAAEVHILATLYIGALSIYYLVQQVQHIRNKQPILQITPSIAFFLSAFVAGVLYLFIHVVPDPQAYFLIARDCPHCAPANPLKELARFIVFIYKEPIELTISILALGVIWVRRTSVDKHLLLLIVGYLITQAIISPPQQIEYAIHSLPILALSVGGIFFTQDSRSKALTKQQFISFVGVSIVLIGSHLPIISVALTLSDEPSPSMQYILDYVPTDTVIMSGSRNYYHFIDYSDFMSYGDGGPGYGITLRDETFQTYYEREQPQVFLGTPRQNDRALAEYMITYDFIEVEPTVWISGDLLEALIGAQSEPIVNFTASSETITLGNCTSISWSVTNADDVLLNNTEVLSEGEQEICPFYDAEYILDVGWIGGATQSTLIIEVE